MKTFTWCLRALSGLALLATPALTNAQAQTWQWATAPTAITDPSGGPNVSGGSGISVMVLDAAGNTVVAGAFYGSITLGTTTLTSAGYTDIFVAKVSPTGAWLQAVQAGGPGEDYVSALKLDAAGNAVLAGRFGNAATVGTATFGAITLTAAGNTSSSDGFVAQLSPSGQWLQAAQVGGPGTDQINAMVLDGAGNAVVTGNFTGSIGLGTTTFSAPAGTGQLFVAKLNLSTGAWTAINQGSSLFSAQPTALALDAAGNMVIAGLYSGRTTLAAPRWSRCGEVARLWRG